MMTTATIPSSSSDVIHQTSSPTIPVGQIPQYMIYNDQGHLLASSSYYANLPLETYRLRLKHLHEIYHIQDKQIATDCVFSSGVFSQVKNGEYGISTRSDTIYCTKNTYEEIFRHLLYFYDVYLVMELTRFVNHHHMTFTQLVHQLSIAFQATTEETNIYLRSWIQLTMPLLDRKRLDIALQEHIQDPITKMFFGHQLHYPRFKFHHPFMHSPETNHLFDNLKEFRETLILPWHASEWQQYFQARQWMTAQNGLTIQDTHIYVDVN